LAKPSCHRQVHSIQEEEDEDEEKEKAMKLFLLILLQYFLLAWNNSASVQAATRRLRTERPDNIQGREENAVGFLSRLLLRSINKRDEDTLEQPRQLGIGFESSSPSSAPTIDLEFSMSFNMSMSFSMPMITAPTATPTTPAPTSHPIVTPTKVPTATPTKVPTATPATPAPTKSPTKAPQTMAPTHPPTSSPTTSPPTPSPTPLPTPSPTLSPTSSPTTPAPMTPPPTTAEPTVNLPPFTVTPPDVVCEDSSTWEEQFFETFEESFGPFEPTGPGVMRVPSEMFAYEGVWSVRLVGNSTGTDALFTTSIPIESNRVQLTFLYLPNEILDFPAASQKGLSVEFMLHTDSVWMLGKRLVVGEDFVNDSTIWNSYCLQLDLPTGPSDVAFRFRLNGDLPSDQIFLDNVALLVE
jgi:hypothetical protein